MLLLLVLPILLILAHLPCSVMSQQSAPCRDTGGVVSNPNPCKCGNELCTSTTGLVCHVNRCLKVSCKKGENLFEHPIEASTDANILQQCNLQYCNSYPQLKTLFCSGAECTTDVQSQKCHDHWVTIGRYDSSSSFRSIINVDACRAPPFKMVTIPKGSSPLLVYVTID